ncbi:MAG: PD-(D/E)XK nuclease family transposase [Bacteroidales bacterium]|nr:PD-(D/E)XK nuclease family transposase [Bacteroidales bacterium]
MGRNYFSISCSKSFMASAFSVHKGSDQFLFRYNLQEKSSHEEMIECLQFLFLELPNCKKALTPEATVLDNFCYALQNISRMEKRPAGLEGEIFDLLFKSAEISTFAGSEREKYFEDMTTKEDIKRMIAFAEDKGIEKAEKDMAIKMMEKGFDWETISELTGLPIPAIQALK